MVEVKTWSSRLVERACAAELRMKRETPLTSARVSVKRRRRTGRSVAERAGEAVRGVARKGGVARRRGGGLKIASKAGRHAAEIRAALRVRRCAGALEDSLHPGFLQATRCAG